MTELGRARLRETADVLKAVAGSRALAGVEEAAQQCLGALRAGGKVFFLGNGGSASQADHLAAELSGRFMIDREPLAALALGGSLSATTAVANDYGFEHVYSRHVRALGRAGDVAVGLSTSGASANVVEALTLARRLDMVTVAFVGGRRGPMHEVADVVVDVPSTVTARVQEAHLVLGHLLCEIIEDTLFG